MIAIEGRMMWCPYGKTGLYVCMYKWAIDAMEMRSMNNRNVDVLLRSEYNYGNIIFFIHLKPLCGDLLCLGLLLEQLASVLIIVY